MSTFQQEKTFSTYTKQQGEVYKANRHDYHKDVYDTILNKHTASGGQLDTVMDIGCAPGLATRTLALSFAHAIGLDPSNGMIETARTRGLVTATGEAVRFEVSSASELGSNLSLPILDGSIDLITAANAAHWFNMTEFWPAAARVLKPGGSVVFWCSGEIRAHPDMPNANGLDGVIERHEEEVLKPYMMHGNLLTKGRYKDLPLPWDVGVQDFEKADFERVDWPKEKQFYNEATDIDLDTFEKMRATSSITTRWREAHPHLVGTDQDVVKVLRRDLERVLHATGVKPGEEKLKGIVHGAVLIVKKRK